MTSLRDMNVVVTGASRGIGPVIAESLVRRGARVAAVARDAQALERTCEELRAFGGHAVPIDADLSDISALPRLVERVEAALGEIDILVNNAGVEYYRRYTDYTAEQLSSVLAVNLHAPMELSRRLLPGMLERGRGHIVSIASLAGKRGVLFNGPYSASKAGLILWTEALRSELKDTAVGISVIMPGYIREAGMFHDGGVEPPRMLGTSSPQDVADAVVEAIEHERPEIIVNPGPMRPLLALGQLSPSLADRLVDWLGVNRLSERRRHQREKTADRG
jgi:short-subunit dehydrogenase